MAARELIDLPDRMAKLPRDPRGYPIPQFVFINIDGVADFRVIRPGWVAHCVNQSRCWLCGERLGAYQVFVIGPMSGINRVSSEPPSHRDCALFAAKNCPFLTRPLAKRNERDLPEDHVAAPGVAVTRNPGLCLLWTTRTYIVFEPGAGQPGLLFRLSPPTTVEFFAHGQRATRAEIDEAVSAGLPLLEEMARAEGDVPMRELRQQVTRFQQLLSARAAA